MASFMLFDCLLCSEFILFNLRSNLKLSIRVRNYKGLYDTQNASTKEATCDLDANWNPARVVEKVAGHKSPTTPLRYIDGDPC